jgi:hypothetical protein
MLGQGARDVQVGKSDWLVAIQKVKDVLSCVRITHGEQFVMISGTLMMQLLFVVNLATPSGEQLLAHELSLDKELAISSWMMSNALALRLFSPTVELAPLTTANIVKMLVLHVLQIVSL